MDIIINSTIDSKPFNTIQLPHFSDYFLNILSVLDNPESKIPLADFLAQYYGLKGTWLVVSPIYWQATHCDAFIVESGPSLQLSEEEGQLWFEVLASYFKDVGFRLHYHNAYTWLLLCDELPEIKATPLNLLTQKSILQAVQSLDESGFWQRLFTELQMFFSGHDLNRQRSYPINGVWFWGNGHFERTKRKIIYSQDNDATLAHVLSDDPKRISYPHYVKEAIFISSTPLERNSSLSNKPINWYWNNLAFQEKISFWQKLMNWRDYYENKKKITPTKRQF